MPRPNGYQSLHTSVVSERGMPFEVQIRTEEMHRQAEEGIAAHWKYKEGRVGDQRDERYFQWMRQLLEWQQEVRDPQEFIQNLKIDLYPEEVYIFTPKGEVKSLPRGATPVDFAYAIHTDIGHQLRRRARQRQDGAAAHAAEERRHRRDRDPGRPQAEPRLAEFRRHVARAATRSSTSSSGEEKARSVELGRKLFDKEARRFDLNPKTLVETRGVRKARRRVRRQQGRRADRRDRLRQAVAAHGARASWCRPTSLQEKAPDGARRRRSSSACCGTRRGEDQGARRGRPDGLPRPLLQPDSRREDRRLHHARQGRRRCTRRPARTS